MAPIPIQPYTYRKRPKQVKPKVYILVAAVAVALIVGTLAVVGSPFASPDGNDSVYDPGVIRAENSDVNQGTQDNPSVFSEEPANPAGNKLTPYTGVIYFEENAFFEGDRWVWIDALGCPVIEPSKPWIIASRYPQGDEFTLGEQVDYVYDNWRPVVEEYADDTTVAMIATGNIDLGFRLSDGASDESMEAFASELNKFLLENDPCNIPI